MRIVGVTSLFMHFSVRLYMILESQSKHEITYFKSSNNELILNLIKNYSFCLVRLCSIVMSSEEAPQKKKKRMEGEENAVWGQQIYVVKRSLRDSVAGLHDIIYIVSCLQACILILIFPTYWEPESYIKGKNQHSLHADVWWLKPFVVTITPSLLAGEQKLDGEL